MSYATSAQLAERLGADLLTLTADDDGDGAPDPAVLDAALADAAAEIDAALGTRYAVPVDPFPAVMERWCIDLALERLLLRRREALTTDQADRAALARRALQAIADGLVGLAGAQPVLAGAAPDSTRLGEPLHFGRERLDTY